MREFQLHDASDAVTGGAIIRPGGLKLGELRSCGQARRLPAKAAAAITPFGCGPTAIDAPIMAVALITREMVVAAAAPHMVVVDAVERGQDPETKGAPQNNPEARDLRKAAESNGE